MAIFETLDAEAPKLDLLGNAQLGMIGCAFFVALNVAEHIVLTFVYPGYSKLASDRMHEYRMLVNSVIHATAATCFAWYCMWYTCPAGQTYFNSEECRYDVRNSHVWTTIFTASFLTVDFMCMILLSGVKTKMDRQHLAHHFTVAAAYFLALWKQDFVVSTGAVSCFFEVSTPFITLRQILFFHEMKDHWLMTVARVGMFFTFIFGRIATQIYITFWFIVPWLRHMWFVQEGVEDAYKALLVFIALGVALNLVMNLFWGKIIVNNAVKIFIKGQEDSGLNTHSDE